MRNKEMLKKMSVKFVTAIMIAAMSMSPVAATLAFPMTVYAANYDTTDDVPEDNDGHRNLTAEDILTTNTSTIHENNGTIVTNAPGAVVEVNNNIVTDNYGDVANQGSGSVGTNHVGGTVSGTGSIDENYGNVTGGTVTDNYASGTVTGTDSRITGDNFGTAKNIGQVGNNYANVTDANVTNNYSSGTVNENTKDNVQVENNFGGTLGAGVDAITESDADPGPNADKLNQTDPNPPAPAPQPQPEPPQDNGNNNDNSGSVDNSGSNNDNFKIEVEPYNGNQDNPSGQNQDASNPAVTTPAIDTSATALATATWDGASIKIGETTVTVSAFAAQDCAGLASTAVTQAELTVVYESIFASTIAANGRSVADARAEALRIATSLAEYITKDLPTNYTPAEAATYKAAYMDAFLKAIASGKTLKKARNAALSAARTKMAQALLDQLNGEQKKWSFAQQKIGIGMTIGIETPVTTAATQASVVGEAADPVAAQMIAQAQQEMQDASALANGQ
ncbi:MAG: hypothetical protein II842_01045 [Butyrivibrio sp.]|nr:hypothetical protein [Butyrivibrio sp.]